MESLRLNCIKGISGLPLVGRMSYSPPFRRNIASRSKVLDEDVFESIFIPLPRIARVEEFGVPCAGHSAFCSVSLNSVGTDCLALLRSPQSRSSRALPHPSGGSTERKLHV